MTQEERFQRELEMDNQLDQSEEEPTLTHGHSCLYCGAATVILSTGPESQKSSIAWCEIGHVYVVIGIWTKKIFDFRSYPESTF